jgi:hypothetical protein
MGWQETVSPFLILTFRSTKEGTNTLSDIRPALSDLSAF